MERCSLRGRPISEGAVWPYRVVVFPPILYDDLGFCERVEDLPVEQFIAKSGIEALTVSVFPW